MEDLRKNQDDMRKGLLNVMWEPSLWIWYARTMKEAADVLFSRSGANNSGRNVKGSKYSDLVIPATLLYGYAMENVIKALVIKRKPKKGPDYIDYKGHRGWSGHNLVCLLKSVGFELDGDEKCFLDTLSAYIIWAGKYPAPFKEEHLLIPDGHPDRNSCAAGDTLPEPVDKLKRTKFELLFKRILKECTDKNRA